MILNFPGGVHPDERTRLGRSPIENTEICSALCIEACDNAVAHAQCGTKVSRGALLGYNGETPVYAPLSGMFRGIMELDGNRYFVVMAKADGSEEKPFAPEERALTELTGLDILESAKKLGVMETRSGLPLWELLKKAGGNCRRLVIDCTESDPAAAINYRLCIERAEEIVAGAKILLRATGALKCVFAAEHYRRKAFEAIFQHATDKKLFVPAELEEKYPYGDRALMYALYVKTLKKDKTALDEGVFIVSPETALALYNCMLSGTPHLDRYITVCGKVKKGGNYRVPRGIIFRDIVEICGGMEENSFFVENSLLSGKQVFSSLSDGTRTLIAAKETEKIRSECISCGRCAEVCPVKLVPAHVLAGDRKNLAKHCVSCGACEYICPGGIPLLSLIKEEQ